VDRKISSEVGLESEKLAGVTVSFGSFFTRPPLIFFGPAARQRRDFFHETQKQNNENIYGLFERKNSN
jgi:hypothetical protein